MTDSVPENETATAPPAADGGQNGTKDRVKWTREHRLAFGANIASFLNVGFTAVAFLILVLTLWTTQANLTVAQQAVTEARQANQISNHALAAAIGSSVHVGHNEFRLFTEAGELTKIHVMAPIGNNGGTGTRGLIYAATCTDFAVAPRDPFNYARLSASRVYHLTLAPKEEVRPSLCSFTIADWARITVEQGSIYVYGYASYRDTIDLTERHYLEFCTRLYGLTFTSSAFNPGPYAQGDECEHHNCTDDECKTR